MITTTTKKAIICIDDEKTILNSLKGQLKRNFGKDYQYEFSEDPQEALEMIEDLVTEGTKVLIIVSDWLMPGMKGDEFLIEVHKKYPQIVKVMLTGQADGEAVQRAKEKANLYRCISKPWTEQNLIDTIKTGIEID
jgi:DNA-binding NtrC family response regulator